MGTGVVAVATEKDEIDSKMEVVGTDEFLALRFAQLDKHRHLLVCQTPRLPVIISLHDNQAIGGFLTQRCQVKVGVKASAGVTRSRTVLIHEVDKV